MRIKGVTLEAFKSFSNKVTFSFGETAGLYSIVGKNSVDKELDSNGAGKSTLVNGVCWVLFGATIEGAKAGSIHTWGSSKKTSGSVEFEDYNGKLRVVTRTYKPNSIVIDGKKVEQLDLEDILGYNRTTFSYGLMMGQFSDSFFDLKPTAALSLLTEILSLDKWDCYRDKARVLVSGLREDISSKEQVIHRCEGMIESMKGISYKNESKQWSDAHEIELDAIETEYNAANEKISWIEKDVCDYKDELSRLERPIRPSHSSVDASMQKKGELIAVGNNCTREILALEKEIVRVKKLEGTCPNCASIVTEEHVCDVVAGLTYEVEEKQKEQEKHSKAEARAIAQLRTAQETFKHASDLYEAEQETYAMKKNNVSAIVADLNRAITEASRLEKRFDIANEAIDPFIAKQQQAEAALDTAVDKLAVLQQQLSSVDTDLKNTEYWDRGFKDIKLSLTASALSSFELEANKALISLGLAGWAIRLVVEQETKSRTISKGFKVEIDYPGHNSPVTLADLSGGEAQRIRLAGTLGIMNLIQGVNGVSDLIILDEPSRHLNRKGVTDLLDTLSNYAYTEGKRIWVIDHTLPDYAFAKSIEVIKTKEGSELHDISIA